MKYNVITTEMPIVLPDRRIYGRAFTPEGKEGRLRAVILSHGYNSSHQHLCDLASALAENGIFAYCYDFCGGSVISRSSGSSLDMSVQSEMGDLRAVISHIEGLDLVDSEQLYLYGESQGGFVSSLTADEKIKGLYLLYPAFCIPDDWNGKTIDGETDFMGMKISNSYCEGLPRYDVFEHIGKYHGPVKIYHGDSDRLVALSYAYKAAESFPNAELEVFPGEDHGFAPEARKKLVEMICADLA